MGTIVDARGVACPQPAIRSRNALRAGDAVTTIVDSETFNHKVNRTAEEAGSRIAEALRNAGKVVSL